MMNNNIILINCDYTELIAISKLEAFQGDLKEDTSKSERRKFKDDVIRLGFNLPVVLWWNTTTNEKTKLIADGHGRKDVYEELIKEGYTIQNENGECGVPCIWVKAPDRKTLADILLGYNNRFRKMNEVSLAKFIENNDLDIKDVLSRKTIPDIDLNKLIKQVEVQEDSETVDTETVEPEYDIQPKFRESYNSLVIICTNEMDWVSLNSILQIPKRKSFKNENLVGTTRAINFQDFIEKIEDYKLNNDS